jgi:hypothetical protein
MLLMLGIGKRKKRSRILRWIIISLSRATLDSLLIRFVSCLPSSLPYISSQGCDYQYFWLMLVALRIDVQPTHLPPRSRNLASISIPSTTGISIEATGKDI